MATRRSQRLSQKLKSYKEEESISVDSDDDRDEDYGTGDEEEDEGDDDDDDNVDDDDGDDDYIFQRKKKKVDEETSIYFNKRKSRQGKVAKKSESQRKRVKNEIHECLTVNPVKSENENSECGTTGNQPVRGTAINIETKTLSLSDSESSSDEFVKAPDSLDSLGDFEKVSRKSDEKGSMDHINKDNLDYLHGLAIGLDVKEEVADGNEHFYDFSHIIKSQQLINSIKKESENSKSKDHVVSTNQVSKSQKQKINLKRTKLGTKRKEDCKSDVNNLNVSELLNLGEGSSVKCEQKKVSVSDEEISDSEKLKDISLLPKEGIEVTIQLPDMQKKKKKKQGFDLEAAMKRRINLIKKENQSFMHKVHVLCWIAHGNYLNDVVNSSDLMGLALSLIPSQHCYPPKRADLTYLEKLVQWFVKKLSVNENYENKIEIIKLSLPSILQKEISETVAFSKRDLVLIFVCILRSLGLSVRLIISLQPVPLKPPASELLIVSTKKEDDKNSVESKGKKTAKSEINKVSKPSESKKEPSSSSNKQSKKPKVKPSQYFSSSDGKSSKESNRKLNKTQSASKNEKSSSYFEKNNLNDESKLNKLRRSLRDRKSTPGSYADRNQSCSDDEATKSRTVDKSNTNKGKQIKKHMHNTKKVVAGKGSSESSEVQHKNEHSDKKNNIEIMDTSSDEDFEPTKTKHGSHKKQKDRRVLSSDEEPQSNERKKKKVGSDYWAEVFLEAEEKWISVDVIHGKVHCVQQLNSGATHPLMYVLAWNNEKTIKDVTRRYAPQWMTVTRKLRVDSEWWNETMAPFAPAKTAREKEEDEDLDRQLQDKPLPTSVTEYKNHPLYALKRHLLKFEGIYPPDAPPLGFVRGEPVYSRSCVMELHTRETWIKEAKVVRKGEEPYKIVKARPKYDKMSGKVINDLPLPLFGYWQVEDYVPPPAVDGKVPRNEYGNVEMYKPCMLPPGTVHLQIPGLNRVARKLNVDCAPAVVGWEFHCGGSHPILDGFIVCEEFKDMLLDAWNQEVEESARRAKEKEEKEVYGNWKRLIKGLLIRERLKARYEFGTEASTSDKHKKKKTTKTKNVGKSDKQEV